jgi:hypothetical protein
LGVTRAGDFSGGGFPEHREDKFEVVHVVAVKRTGALGGQLRVFNFLDAFVADLGEPALERLGLGAGDGPDQTEQALGVGAVEILWTASGGDGKGGGNLPPPFGQLRVAAAHVLKVALGINRVGQCRDHVGNDKPPLIVVNGATDFFVLKQRNARFRIRQRVAHIHPLVFP